MIFLKGVCHDIFDLYFVHDSNPSGPLIDRLWLSCQNMKNSKNSCHTDMLYYFFMCMLIMHAFWKVVILKIESTVNSNTNVCAINLFCHSTTQQCGPCSRKKTIFCALPVVQ